MTGLQNANTTEFTSSIIDDKIRPFTVGLTRHHETIATIIVYKERDKSDPVTRIDYLEKLEDKVLSLTTAKPVGNSAGSISSGVPDQPSGQVVVDKLDGKNDYYGVFNNFSLLNVNEAHEQIVKLHVNFGADWNAFFFGEKPRVYQFSGFFLDSMDYPYYQEFLVAYDKYLSGRKSVENKVQTKFIYDGKIIDGYMLNIQTAQTAADQLIKTFQFTVLVKGIYWMRTNLVPRLKGIPGNEKVIMDREYNSLVNVNRLKPFELTTGPTIAQNTNIEPTPERIT